MRQIKYARFSNAHLLTPSRQEAYTTMPYMGIWVKPKNMAICQPKIHVPLAFWIRHSHSVHHHGWLQQEIGRANLQNG